MTRRVFCKVLLVIVAVFGLLVLSSVLSAQGRSEDAFERVRDVQERNTDRLLAMDGVEGTAIGYNQNDRLAIKVFTAGPGVRGIPQTLDGVPVQVVVTGKFYALARPDTPPGQAKGKDKEETIDPTEWFPRPVPIGVSTSSVGPCAAGTIGCRVIGLVGSYALSNSHVYGTVGVEVLQPGLFDTGCVYDVANVIGEISASSTIEFFVDTFDPDTDIENTIDAAIAVIYEDIIDNTSVPRLDNATPLDGYGTPDSETELATLGMEVQKYGRTTGLTKGIVSELSVTVDVRYADGVARFKEQIAIVPTRGRFSNAGDSGSLIVTDDDSKYPVGLLFAGGARRTVANPIDAVLEQLGVSIDGSTE